MNSLSILLSLLNLQSISSEALVGRYQSISIASNKCSTKDSLVLKESFFVRSYCGDAPEYKYELKFGKWINNDDKVITTLFADPTPPHNIIIESNSTLRDGKSDLEKVEVTPIDKVAEIFGTWKAKDPQPLSFCKIAKSLEINSNGQIVRYSCKNGYPNWFERGFFSITTIRGSKTTLRTTFNGTSSPLTLQVSDSNRELLVDDQVFLFRQ